MELTVNGMEQLLPVVNTINGPIYNYIAICVHADVRGTKWLTSFHTIVSIIALGMSIDPVLIHYTGYNMIQNIAIGTLYITSISNKALIVGNLTCTYQMLSACVSVMDVGVHGSISNLARSG